MTRHSSPVTRHFATALRCLLTTVACLLAATLLLAILICSLAPSSYMTEIPFIPTWLGTWADANPNFRNFPVFSAFAALLFLVATFYQPLVTSYGQWRLAFGVFVASSLLGALLEVAQALIPERCADPFDVMWMTLGAFVGAFGFVCLYRNAPFDRKVERRLQ